MFEENYEFQNGAEFWLGKYYDTSGICIHNTQYSDEFANFIVKIFSSPLIRNELCALIDEIFRESFSDFKPESSGDINCFEDGPIYYDKKFKYIRLPNFRSEYLKKFQLRISINPCLSIQCSATKIYCNSLLHEKISEKNAISFYQRSNKLCDTVSKYISKIYLKHFIEFIEQNNIAKNISSFEDKFENEFILRSSFVGSADKELTDMIRQLSMGFNFKKLSMKKIKFMIKLVKDINKSLGLNFSIRDYQWNLFNVEDKDKHQYNAILGYAENNNLGHMVGISDSTPRKILLPLHVKLILDN